MSSCFVRDTSCFESRSKNIKCQHKRQNSTATNTLFRPDVIFELFLLNFLSLLLPPRGRVGCGDESLDSVSPQDSGRSCCRERRNVVMSSVLVLVIYLLVAMLARRPAQHFACAAAVVWEGSESTPHIHTHQLNVNVEREKSPTLASYFFFCFWLHALGVHVTYLHRTLHDRY